MGLNKIDPTNFKLEESMSLRKQFSFLGINKKYQIMKKLNYWLFTFTLLFLMSCDKKENEVIVCDGDCVFVLENVEAEMVLLNCFEKYGIKTVHPDDENIIIYGIPESVEKQFEEEGKQITFTAKFRPNTLVPVFPDPNIGPETLYEIEVMSLK